MEVRAAAHSLGSAPRVATTSVQQGRVVAPSRTPLSPLQIRASLASAYNSLKGAPIDGQLLDVLTAQVCTENAHGAAMHNNNFGGIKGVSPEGTTARMRTREVLDGKSVQITDGFRAYSTPENGAKDYLALLERRFPRALEAGRSGDVEGFARSLKAGNYFTADVGEYAAAMRGVMSRGFDGEVRHLPASKPEVPHGPTPELPFATTFAVARVMDALSGHAAAIVAPIDEEPLK